MKISRGRGLLVACTVMCIVLLAAARTWVWAKSTTTVSLAPTAILKVNTSRLGNNFDVGAIGLSTEAMELSSGRLSAGHLSVVRLMRLLGPSVLRIGGESVDFSWWTSNREAPPPWATNIVTPADLYALRGLLHATGWRVLLGIDLGHFEPVRAAEEARYAHQIFGSRLLGVEIGNEPNNYGVKDGLRPSMYGVNEYLREVETYRQALNEVAPTVALYGPAVTQKNAWLTQMGAAAHIFTEITRHYYPSNTCPGTLSTSSIAPPTAEGLLSPAVREEEDEYLNALALAGSVADRPTRIGETNDSACGGVPAVSPVFASALWALDWSLRAASSGVQGLNFHGNLGVCGSHAQSPICAPTDEAAHTGDLAAQPEYYGLLAARQLEGGRFVRTRLETHDPTPNLTTWATLAPGGTIRIAIDNLAVAGLTETVSLPMSGYTAIDEPVAAPSVEATNSITLGGAPLRSNGSWRPSLRRLRGVRNSLRVVVPPASAVVVILRRRH
jgi:hypothetical protein